MTNDNRKEIKMTVKKRQIVNSGIYRTNNLKTISTAVNFITFYYRNLMQFSI